MRDCNIDELLENHINWYAWLTIKGVFYSHSCYEDVTPHISSRCSPNYLLVGIATQSNVRSYFPGPFPFFFPLAFPVGRFMGE